jgi:hypothetical protein
MGDDASGRTGGAQFFRRKEHPGEIVKQVRERPGMRRTLRESCLTTGGLAEHARARATDDDGLRVRKDRGDGEAAWQMFSIASMVFWQKILTRALHVHEVRVGRLHKALELVRALLGLRERVEEVDGERL